MKSRVLLRGILSSKFEYYISTTRMLSEEIGHVPDCIVYCYPARISSVVLGQISGGYDGHGGGEGAVAGCCIVLWQVD